MAVRVKLKTIEPSNEIRDTIRKMIARHGGRDDSRDLPGKPIVGTFPDLAAARKFRTEASDYRKRGEAA